MVTMAVPTFRATFTLFVRRSVGHLCTILAYRVGAPAMLANVAETLAVEASARSGHIESDVQFLEPSSDAFWGLDTIKS